MVMEISLLAVQFNFELVVAFLVSLVGFDSLNSASYNEPDLHNIGQLLISVMLQDLTFSDGCSKATFKTADSLGLQDVRDCGSDNQTTLEGSLRLIDQEVEELFVLDTRLFKGSGCSWVSKGSSELVTDELDHDA